MASVNLVGQLDADTTALRLRMETLTRQVSTGYKTDQIGDLAPQLPRALTLSAEINRRGVYGSAIGGALTTAATTQTALQQLASIAQNFADGVAMKLDPTDTSSLSSVATQAKAALVQVGQLLDTQSNGAYIFGGSDSANPPIPDPNALPSGGMATAIAQAVAGLGGGNAASVAAATKAAAMDNTAGVTPFSAFLSDPARGGSEPRRSVPAGDGQNVPYGIVANRNAAAVSAGETTGSWARDLMRGLASLAALTPAQAASPDDFRALATTIQTGLKSAENALADEQGALGQTQAQLQTTQTQQTTVTDTLKAQVSDIEEVDLASTLTSLQATQTTLQASYSAISSLGTLTLTAYLK